MALIDLNEEDRKILEQFPKYDNKPKNWVGSREYWEFIFESEKNRNPELHKAFGELHKKIVDEVIQFCKKYNLEVQEFHVGADGIRDSRDFGEWTCFTDSSMSMYTNKVYEDGCEYIDRETPFLYEN